MAEEQGLGAEMDDIRQRISARRSSLVNNINLLEEEVGKSFRHAKDSVRQEFQEWRDVFSVPSQTQKHPWPMFGGAVVLGMLLGRALGSSPGPSAPQTYRTGPGFLESTRNALGIELDQVKTAALAALGSSIKDVVKAAAARFVPPQHENRGIERPPHYTNGPYANGRYSNEANGRSTVD